MFDVSIDVCLYRRSFAYLFLRLFVCMFVWVYKCRFRILPVVRPCRSYASGRCSNVPDPSGGQATEVEGLNVSIDVRFLCSFVCLLVCMFVCM